MNNYISINGLISITLLYSPLMYAQDEQYNKENQYEVFYVGPSISAGIITAKGNIESLSFSEDSGSNTLGGVIGGYRINKYIAIEARAYANLSESDFLGYEVSIDRYYALYGRLILPLGENVEIYALGGYGKQKVTAFGGTDSDSDIAYGLGIEISKMRSPVDLQLEWIHTYDESYSGTVLGYDYNINLEESNLNLNLIFDF